MKKILLLITSSFIIASSFSVEGMMCGVACVNKIQAQIGSLEGVSSCAVNFEKGVMQVDYDESKLNDNQIIAHLAKNTTYKATLLDANTTSYSSSCAKSCCAKAEKVGFFKRIFSWF